MAAFLFAAALLIGAPALKPKADIGIVGEWVVESIQTTGRFRQQTGEPLRYVFTSEGKWIVYRGEQRIGSGSRGYHLDPRKSPAHIDLVSDTTEQEPNVTQGIYKVEGNLLTLCISRGRYSRPTDFKVSKELPGTLYLFKRTKLKE